MINILSELSKKEIQTTLDLHWSNLNQRKKAGNCDYKKSSLIKQCDKLISEYENNTHLRSVANNCNVTNQIHLDFLNNLKVNNYKMLKLLVQSKPEQLVKLTKSIFRKINHNYFIKTKNNKVCSSQFGDLLLKTIFNYKSFRSSDHCILMYKDLKLAGLYCFYCNNNQFEIISKKAPTKSSSTNTNGLLLFDLDHFYLKSKYPFLALSFYNLIPSCNMCNSRLRGDKDFNIDTHINPYIHSFHDHYRYRVDKKLLIIAALKKSLDTLDVEIELIKKSNSNRPKDVTAKDLKLDLKAKENTYKTEVEYVIETFIHYQDRNNQDLAIAIHGVKGQLVPSSTSKINHVNKGKLKLDITNQLRILRSMPEIT